MSKFGDLINEMLRKDLTGPGNHGRIEEFCRATGTPRNTLRNWLDGTAIPLAALPVIADWFHTTPEKLIKSEGTEPTQAPQSKSSLIGNLVLELASMDEAKLKTLSHQVRTNVVELPRPSEILTEEEHALLNAFRKLPPGRQAVALEQLEYSASLIHDEDRRSDEG